MNAMKLFTGRAHPALARRICEYLGLPLGRAVMGNFPDGEISCKIDEDVRGRDVFLIQPTCPPVNENLMELLIMIESFRRASADRITAVIPYYGYARQDRKDEGRVPITAKLVANLITTAGANRVLTMDLHAPQIQGFFDVPVDHRRASAVETEQANLIGGPLDGKVALLFDDMITTAGSIVGAAAVVKRHGARQIYVCATHAILCGPAIDRLRRSPITQVVLTDTIPVPPEKQLPNLKTLSVAPLLGEAIKRIHRNESVSKLFD